MTRLAPLRRVKLTINGSGVEFDRDYGVDRQTGWSAVRDGCVIVQLVSLRRALWALLFATTLALVACGSSPSPRPCTVQELRRIDVHLPPALEPMRPTVAANVEKIRVIINAHGGCRSPVSSLRIWDHLACKGSGVTPISHRIQGGWIVDGSLRPPDPYHNCTGHGPVRRDGWAWGFAWEYGHLWQCAQDNGDCGDGPYTLPAAAEIDREITALEWEGETLVY